MKTEGSFEFLRKTSGTPYYDLSDPGIGRQRSGDFELVTVAISDARVTTTKPDVDAAGYALVSLPTNFEQPPKQGAQQAAYHDEIVRHVRAVYPVKTIDILDTTVRQTGGGDGVSAPVTHAHNDYTEASAWGHLHRLHPEISSQADIRLIQLNYWRSFTSPLNRDPLAILDPVSLDERDLVPCKVFYPDRTGEVFEVRHNPAQRWVYFPQMTRDEVLVFKGFDSKAPHGARFVPHAAFALPDADPAQPTRVSVEVRVLLTV